MSQSKHSSKRDKATPNLALKGVKILDLGMFWAGPYCGALLADLGAEVIKVESCRRPDPLRIQARGIYPQGDPGERPWNRSGMINERNRNKYGITLDLTLPKGREIFKKLVKQSDVIIENFSRKVMGSWDLDYPQLKEVNPAIIMISLSSQGLTGPDKDHVSFGPTLEDIGGLSYITGYPDQISTFMSFAYPDALAGVLGAGAVIAALRHRRKTGEGMHIDLSQRELTTCIIGEVMMDYAMNRRVKEAAGNRHPTMAPYGCYPCQGEDKWITITISSDNDWGKLCQIMGKVELADDERFSDLPSRWHNQDKLDEIITEWTKGWDHYDLMHNLQKAGLAAGAVLNMKELFDDPHLKEREFFKAQTHPEAGTHLYKGKPIRLTKTPLREDMPAPCLGEHNSYIFSTLLGISPEEIVNLEEEGVIGNTPTSQDLQFT